MTKRVERTRNAGTQTEAAYWSMVRSVLRRGFRFWKPATNGKMKARRKYTGENKRQRWEYQCNHCKGWFKDKDIQIDHVIACGQLKCLEDVSGFLERLTAEGEESFQILCKPCHQKKTNQPQEAEKCKAVTRTEHLSSSWVTGLPQVSVDKSAFHNKHDFCLSNLK